MRFTSLVAFLPLASAASILVSRADLSSDVLKNLTAIETDVKALNDTLNVNGDTTTVYDFAQLYAINTASAQVSSDVNSTAGTANASDVATAAESQSILTEIQSNLQPSINSLLDNLVAHKPAFGGAASIVGQNLVSQRELTRELGNALAAKADPSLQSQATDVSNAILAKFDSTITTFQS